MRSERVFAQCQQRGQILGQFVVPAPVEASALEVVTPVEVVDAVGVVAELDRVLLPEAQARVTVTSRLKAEAERSALPWVVSSHSASPARGPHRLQ